MIRPPRPAATIARPAARHRKNAALRLTSCWKSQSSSVTSSRLFPAPEDRGQVRERVETAQLGPSLVDQRPVGGQIGQIDSRSRMTGALEAANDLVHLLLVEVDRHDPGAGGRELSRP